MSMKKKAIGLFNPMAFYKISVVYLLELQVDNPNRVYKGQKLIKLVSVNTPANTNNTIPNVPVTVWEKYSPTKITAISNRKIRSIAPMFFFIIYVV